MRKIEKLMLKAINEVKPFRLDNTEVIIHASHPASSRTIEVKLHGHSIALISGADGFLTVNIETLRNWPTRTTKSRLRALGADLVSKRGKLFLNGKEV
jgi:hypothetical protein